MTEPRDPAYDATPPATGPGPVVRAEADRAGHGISREHNSAYPDTYYRPTFRPARQARIVQAASSLNFLIGLWVLVAPWVLSFSRAGSVVWAVVGTGGMVAFLAMLRLAMPLHLEALSWVNLALGGWLIVVPFVFDYPAGYDATVVHWNDIVAGAVIVLLAAWSGSATDRARVHRTR